MDSNQWDKARGAYERHKLEQIPQCQAWEYGPSNRLAIFPGLIGALRMDFEFSCSSYRHVQEITADLTDYEKYLLWQNLPSELIAKIQQLKANWNRPVIFGASPYAVHTAARPKPAPKPKARTTAAGRF